MKRQVENPIKLIEQCPLDGETVRIEPKIFDETTALGIDLIRPRPARVEGVLQGQKPTAWWRLPRRIDPVTNIGPELMQCWRLREDAADPNNCNGGKFGHKPTDFREWHWREASRGTGHRRLAELIAPKSLIEPAINHRLVILHSRHNLVFRVQEDNIRNRPMLRRFLDLHDDSNTATRHRANILTILAHGARQRGPDHILKSPQDHQLEGAVNYQRIG